MILLVLGSAALTLFGVLAYLGVIRRWSPVDRGLDEYLGFSALYAGLTLGCFALSGATKHLAAGDVFLWAGCVLIVVTLLSIFYLPKFLLPKWWKDAHLRSRGK